jgi:16S rRNA (guanine527-N7)-methyltransferase
VSDPRALLTEGAARILGRPLTAAEADSFVKYLDLLRKWNKAQRLIGTDAPAWIVEHLFLDSLLFLLVLPPEVASIVDLGSGAGIPGIPLKIVRPALEVRLVESRGRRASFLSAAIRELGLRGIAVVHGRAEDHLAELRGRFDAVVMRCAGPAERVMGVAGEIVRPGGLIVSAAGPSVARYAGGVREVPGVKLGTTRRFVVQERSDVG